MFEFNFPTDTITYIVCYTIIIVSMLVLISTLGAFFFARFKFSGSNILFLLFIALVIYAELISVEVSFKHIHKFKFERVSQMLTIIGILTLQAFVIYGLRNFIKNISRDIFESIEIDGGNILHQMWHVVLPMTMSTIVILATLQVISICYIYEMVNYG